MKYRIMVIDDEESIRLTLQIYLGELGYEVHTAADPSGCGAFNSNQCRADGPCADILIIDQVMTGVTGLQYLLEREDKGCKAAGQHKALVSGNLSACEVAQAEDLGCKIFHKPFRMEQIQAWIEVIESNAVSGPVHE